MRLALPALTGGHQVSQPEWLSRPPSGSLCAFSGAMYGTEWDFLWLCMGPAGRLPPPTCLIQPGCLRKGGRGERERGRGGQEELCSAARETLARPDWLTDCSAPSLTTTGLQPDWLTDQHSLTNYTANIGNLARNFRGIITTLHWLTLRTVTLSSTLENICQTLGSEIIHL